MKVFTNRIMLGLLAFSLMAWIAVAANVTGIWKGTTIYPGNGQKDPVTLNLHENAGGVTGTGDGLAPNSVDIVNGKVTGDQISFEMKGKDDNGKPFTMNFSGKISGNQIQGSIDAGKGNGGVSITVTKQ